MDIALSFVYLCDQSHVFQGERGPYTRPWQSPVPPLETSVDELVQYPSDSEDTGMVLAAWRGPSSVTHFNE